MNVPSSCVVTEVTLNKHIAPLEQSSEVVTHTIWPPIAIITSVENMSAYLVHVVRVTDIGKLLQDRMKRKRDARSYIKFVKY
jgi:hypothetical protein